MALIFLQDQTNPTHDGLARSCSGIQAFFPWNNSTFNILLQPLLDLKLIWGYLLPGALNTYTSMNLPPGAEMMPLRGQNRDSLTPLKVA